MHDKNEIVKYYNASDLYIHLANAENFPTTILEAMHCGLPVIGSNIGGIQNKLYMEKQGFCSKIIRQAKLQIKLFNFSEIQNSEKI